MGMLVTMLLITITVYKGVEAPKSRGFSLIEVWMVGNMIPIIAAILEFGVILYFMRVLDSNKISSKTVMIIDQLTMLGLITYFVIFQTWFWNPYI